MDIRFCCQLFRVLRPLTVGCIFANTLSYCGQQLSTLCWCFVVGFIEDSGQSWAAVSWTRLFRRCFCYLDLVNVFDHNVYRTAIGKTVSMLLLGELKKWSNTYTYTYKQYQSLWSVHKGLLETAGWLFSFIVQYTLKSDSAEIQLSSHEVLSHLTWL